MWLPDPHHQTNSRALQHLAVPCSDWILFGCLPCWLLFLASMPSGVSHPALFQGPPSSTGTVLTLVSPSRAQTHHRGGWVFPVRPLIASRLLSLHLPTRYPWVPALPILLGLSNIAAPEPMSFSLSCRKGKVGKNPTDSLSPLHTQEAKKQQRMKERAPHPGQQLYCHPFLHQGTTCRICRKTCRAQIGFFRHLKTHQ